MTEKKLYTCDICKTDYANQLCRRIKKDFCIK